MAVTWQQGPGVPDVDVSALLLDATGRVRADAGLVFRNRPARPSGTVRHPGEGQGAGGTSPDRLWPDPASGARPRRQGPGPAGARGPRGRAVLRAPGRERLRRPAPLHLARPRGAGRGRVPPGRRGRPPRRTGPRPGAGVPRVEADGPGQAGVGG
ncbi:TerD family protein [Streptomyces caelestis]|uniref:TerD family protein n=1 Tax=Streptomyces caelestis TaxID=36816 RepID=UPI00364B0758